MEHPNQKGDDRDREIGQIVILMTSAIKWLEDLGLETIAIEAMRVRLALQLQRNCVKKV